MVQQLNGSLNGSANGIPGASPQQQAQLEAFIKQYEPAQLRRRIQLREQALQPIYTRFDADFKLRVGDLFQGIGDDLYDSDQYLHYTSNEPQNFGKKITNWYNNASLIIRIDTEGRSEPLTRVDSAKERLGYGFLNAIDKRLKRKGQNPLRNQSGWQIAIRGPVFARTMLRVDRQGKTIVDVTPWDPRNVIWDYGPDGLAWCAYKIAKTRDQIQREYGVRLENSTDEFNAQDQTGIVVYDFYDDVINATFTEDMQMLKRPSPHMMPRIPVAYSFGGTMPLLSNATTSGSASGTGSTSSASTPNAIRYFSESIYETNREVYKWENYVLSIGLHLTAQSRDPGKLIFSSDGTRSLDADASLPGAEIPMSVRNQEALENLPPVELTNTAQAMLGLIQAQVQQGSLSPVHFGNTPFSLSGFAINSLGVSAEEKIQPVVEQGEDFYLMMLEILMEQYATGAFPVLTVSGRGRDGGGFNEAIPPQVAQIGGEMSIEMNPNLPEDDIQKIQQAQLLRQPGVDGMPLVDDLWIRDYTMKIRDVDNMEDRLRGQLAERGSPLATVYTNWQAAVNNGDQELAFIYQQQGQFIMFQMWAATQGIIVPQLPPVQGPEIGSPAANMQQNTGGAGVPPQASPPQANGIQNAPSQQAGPNVPAGTPRPGAQAQPGQPGG